MKRFYDKVETAQDGQHARLLLDGRPIKTPGKRVLEVPARAFAEAVAAEWASQSEEIVPATMPLTRLANSVVDGVAANAAEVRATLVAYGETDVICHWAEGPQALVARQAAAWQPVLDWYEDRLGVRFEPVEGIVAAKQDAAALRALERDIEVLDPFALGALHEMTTLTGSILLSVAALRGAIAPAAAWDAAHVDEAFQIEQWGEDAEAKARHDLRRAAFGDAVRALKLLGAIS